MSLPRSTELPDKFAGTRLKDSLDRGISWLSLVQPKFKDRRFWVIQLIIIIVAVTHDYLEITGNLHVLGPLYFLPISIFFLPVTYAALNFGLSGGLITAFWMIIVSIPNWIFWDHDLSRYGEMFHMLLFVLVAFFVGQRVDREAAERKKAETASAALKNYTAYVVNIGEKERQHIAHELHDQTVQKVVFLGWQLDDLSAHDTLSETVTEKLRNARKTSDQIVKNLRDFARNLRPPALDDLGLVDSISKLLLDFSDRTGIKSYLSLIGGERRLLPDTEVGLFRIVQEALRNIERHSKANQVIITIAFETQKAELSIKDNGIGFDINSVKQNNGLHNHFGLIGMQERAELFGGKFKVYSCLEGGTTVSVSIPE